MKKNTFVVYLLVIIISIVISNKFFQDKLYITINYKNTIDMNNKKAELFYDIGNGINKNDNLLSNIQYNKAKFIVKNFDKIKKIRIDPVNIQGKILIEDIEFKYGLEYLKIDKTNFNNYLKLINIRNIDLVDYISFESTNNDPIMIISNDMLMKIQKMGNKLNIKYILLNSMVVIIFYLLLLLIYIKRNIFIKYINKVISSKKYNLIVINIFSLIISVFFMGYVYHTLIEIHFENDIVPFSNEIKVYQQNNANIPVSKTQFSSILINQYNKLDDIIIDTDVDKFHINKITLRQNTHLSYNINIAYKTENNKIYVLKKEIVKSKIIYFVINIIIFLLIVNLFYCLFNIILSRKYISKITAFYGTILFIMIVVLYNKFLLFDRYYIFDDIASDSIVQLFPYIHHLSNYIYEYNAIPFVSFFVGLGMNIFSYVMEPFYFLVALFGPDNVPAMMGYMHALRVFLAGIFFYLFLKEKGYDNYTSTIFGLLYAFSGRMISQGTWQTYPNEVVGVALFLYAFELLYNNRNKYLLPLAIALLFSLTTSYYFVLYTIIITAYMIFRFYIDNINPFKNIKKVGYIFISYIIGFSIASPLIITNLIMIRSGSRSGNFQLLTDIDYLKNAVFQITPTIELYTAFFKIFSTNIYGITKYLGSRNYLEDPLFYCGILTVILIPLAFNYINKREKIAYTISILLIFLYVFSPFIRNALSGFSGNYYKISSFWIILIMLYIGAHSLSCIIKNKQTNKLTLFITILILICLVGILGYNRNFDTIYYYLIYIYIALYAIMLFITNDSNTDKIMKIMLVLVIIEIFTMSWETTNIRNTLSLNNEGYNDGTERAIKFIEGHDKSLFYRIEKDYYTKYYADSLIQKYKGTASYNNMAHRKEYNEFVNILNINKYQNHSNYNSSIYGNIYLENLFSVKYRIIRNKNDVPYLYKIIGNIGNLYITKNKLFLPFGIYYTKNINADSFIEASADDKLLNILKYNISNDNSGNIYQLEHNNIDKYKIDTLNMKLENNIINIDNNTKIKIKRGKGSQYIRFNHETNTRNVYFLRYKINTKSNAWMKINILDNETTITRDVNVISGYREYIFEFSGEKYNAIKFDDNIDYEISDLELYIVPEKIYYKPLEDAVNNLRKYKFNIEKFSDSNIIGNISVDKKGTLMFSIPYDKGWKAYIDGKPADLRVAQLAFLGLELEPGNYKIELKFFPPGLKAGIILFIFGIIIYAIYIYIIRKEVKHAYK